MSNLDIFKLIKNLAKDALKSLSGLYVLSASTVGGEILLSGILKVEDTFVLAFMLGFFITGIFACGLEHFGKESKEKDK